MLLTMRIQKLLYLAVFCLHLSGCIGENPKDPNAETTTPTPEPSTTSTPTVPKLEPGIPGVEPAIYGVRTPSEPILTHYMQDYANNNTSLDSRDAHATSKEITKIFEGLKKWSDATTHWTDQHANKLTTPPDNSHVRVMYDGNPSVIATDGAHVVQNLELDKETGVFIADETSINTAQLKLNPRSWIDVRGRMGAMSFEMLPKSIIDLTNGYGFEVNTDIADLSVDKALAQTGVLEVKAAGQGKIDGATITLHKADIKGTLKVKEAKFNFQTRRDNSTENIAFIHTSGQIETLRNDSGGIPENMMTVRGPFKFEKEAEIKTFLDNSAVSKIVLHYPFSTAGMPEANKPKLEGKFEFIPTVDTLTNTSAKGILFIKSNIDFITTLDLSQAILHDEILGKKLTLTKDTIDGDATYTHGIYLKIGSLPTSLSKSLERAITTFKEGKLYTVLEHPYTNLFNINNLKGKLSCFQHTNGSNHNTTHLKNISLELENAFRNHSFILEQSFAHTNHHHTVYKYLPQASQPFWQVHSFIGCKIPTRSPLDIKGGVSYVYIPDTILQSQMQGLFPEASISLKLNQNNHLPISANFIANTMYNAYNNNCIYNYGFNCKIKTSGTKVSCSLLNPMLSSMLFKLSIAFEL